MRCVDALSEHRRHQIISRDHRAWVSGEALVFCSQSGKALDPSHVRREFRNAIRGAQGVDPEQWTPRELRHSFVSLLSDNGVPLEEISRLVGHTSTATIELVYRKQIRPVIQSGAVAMDHIFGESRDA